MAELLLVNPARRKRRKNPMPRALARYWATHRRKRASNPHRRRRRSNPHRRVAHRRRNPSLRAVGARARALSKTGVATFKRGAVGSLGALVNDVLVGQIQRIPHLPDFLTSGAGAALLKGLSALGVAVASDYVPMLRGFGRDLGDGAMTVAIHTYLRTQLQGIAPDWLPLGEYLTFAPTVGYDTGMGEYLTGPGSGLMGEYISSDVGNGDYYGARPAGMLSSY